MVVVTRSKIQQFRHIIFLEKKHFPSLKHFLIKHCRFPYYAFSHFRGVFLSPFKIQQRAHRRQRAAKTFFFSDKKHAGNSNVRRRKSRNFHSPVIDGQSGYWGKIRWPATKSLASLFKHKPATATTYWQIFWSKNFLQKIAFGKNLHLHHVISNPGRFLPIIFFFGVSFSKGNDAFGFFLIFFRRTNISSEEKLRSAALACYIGRKVKVTSSRFPQRKLKGIPDFFFKSAPRRPSLLTVRESGVWKGEGFSHLAT